MRREHYKTVKGRDFLEAVNGNPYMNRTWKIQISVPNQWLRPYVGRAAHAPSWLDQVPMDLYVALKRKASVNVLQMAKGMGTVDFQHKKLDLKPLFPVTAYFFNSSGLKRIPPLFS